MNVILIESSNVWRVPSYNGQLLTKKGMIKSWVSVYSIQCPRAMCVLCTDMLDFNPTIKTIGVGTKMSEFHTFYTQPWIRHIRLTAMQRISSLAFKL